MVLVVASVEVHLGGVDQQEGEEDEEDLHGVLASVHKVSVEHVRLLQGRRPVLLASKALDANAWWKYRSGVADLSGLPCRKSTAGLPAAHASHLPRRKNKSATGASPHESGARSNTERRFDGGRRTDRPQMVISLLWQVEMRLMLGNMRNSFQVSRRSCRT